MPRKKSESKTRAPKGQGNKDHNLEEMKKQYKSKFLEGKIDMAQLHGSAESDSGLDDISKLYDQQYNYMFHVRQLKLAYKEAQRSLISEIELILDFI